MFISQNSPSHYDTLVPLWINSFCLLTWDLVPRWIITLNLDFLNYHNIPTHDDTFVTLFSKSPFVTLLPLAFEYNSVDILVRVCSIQLLKKSHKFAAFLSFYKRFLHSFTHNLNVQYKIATLVLLHCWLTRINCWNSYLISWYILNSTSFDYPSYFSIIL